MEIKLIVLGTYAVGKTSILHKFKNNQFKECSEPTIAIDYVSQVFEIKGKDYKVQFWDTAGQEKYNNITEQYYRKAQGSIIVVSCERPVRDNIAECQKYLSLFKEQTQSLPSLLLFNKLDLVAHGEYLQEINKALKDIRTLQKKYNLIDFKVVSAKTTSSQDFFNIFEPFVKEVAKNCSLSCVETDCRTAPSKLQPSMIEKEKEKSCC